MNYNEIRKEGGILKKFISVFAAMTLLFMLCIPAFSSGELLEPITAESNSPSSSGYISVSEPENRLSESECIAENFGIQKAAPETLPDKYDSRDYGLVTPVKDQGNSGCCWAFGTINALESDAIAKGYYTAETADFSEAHLTWFTYSVINDESNPNNGEGGKLADDTVPYRYGGNWKRAASTLSQGIGIANESDFPFYPYNISEMGNYDESERYDHGSGLVIDRAVKLNGRDDIKRWLMEHGSCTTAFYYKNSYYNSYYGAYYCGTKYSTNHLVSIVGWDDNYSVSNFSANSLPSSDGAWLIKDSWGSDSKKDGYFWISYEDATITDFTGFEVRPADDFYRIYTHNACYSISYLPIPSGGRVSNVYRASGYEFIKSVAFTTITEQVGVTVEIYKNLTAGYGNPTDGTLALTYETFIEKSGYITIDLPTKVAVDEGEIFSVLIKVTNSLGSSINIPLEVPSDGSDAQYVFSAGESYYSTKSSGNMLDVNNQQFGSLYLNALTECRHQVIIREQTADCGNEGYKIAECTQCGNVISGIRYPASGKHQYGEWSPLRELPDLNRRERHRTCSVCGNIDTETILIGSNFVTLDEFLQLIFERITSILKTIFNMI